MIRFAQKAGSLSSAISKLSVVDRLQLVRMMHSLVKNQAFVNGKWTDASDNKRFNVTNPANQKIVGEVPDMNAGDVQKAIDAAYETFHSKGWQNTTAKERSGLLKVSCLSLTERNQYSFMNFPEMVPTSRKQQARNR